MAEGYSIFTKTFLAGGTINTNTVVKGGSADKTVVASAAKTDMPLGIALAAAVSGGNVAVCMQGTCRAVAGAAVTRFAALTADSNGKVVDAPAGAALNGVVGFALEDATGADEIIEIFVNPHRSYQAS